MRRRHPHDPRLHERARAAIYGAVSLLVAIAWFLAIVPREPDVLPAGPGVLGATSFVAATMAIAWGLRRFVARGSVGAACALGVIAPFAAAAVAGELLATVMWITDAHEPHSFVELPASVLRAAFEHLVVVVPLGIASLLALRTVLVVGRHTDDSPAQAR